MSTKISEAAAENNSDSINPSDSALLPNLAPDAIEVLPDNNSMLRRISYPMLLMALVAAITFFSASAVVAYRSVSVITDNNESINNTLQTLNLIKNLHKEIIAAESSQRGYLLTEDAEYLEPYHKTLSIVDDLLLQLSKSTTELPAQKMRFEVLYGYINKKIDEMQRIVALTNRDEVIAAVRQVRTDEGIELMRGISKLVEQMELDEFKLLEKNKKSALDNRKTIVITLLMANILGLFLTLGIFFVWYRNSNRISSLNKKLAQANAELEEKVSARTHALLQYSEELQRSNRELEEFAFVASHDLQEPLRKIRAFGDRLQQKYSAVLGDNGADYVARMQAASGRMSALIDDLLSFSRVTTKQRPFASIDLNDVMRDVLVDLDFAIEDSGAQIQVDPLPIVDADSLQIAQVFLNLISNSLKFCAPQKKPIITINCDTDIASPLENDDRRWCCLRFCDQGIGFEPQYAERVFSLFQRLHGRDAYSGTGIGLALCRKIIERHSGMITAESELGKGSVFIIYLPLTQNVVESLADLLEHDLPVTNPINKSDDV